MLQRSPQRSWVIKDVLSDGRLKVKWNYGNTNHVEADEVQAIDEEADKKLAAAMQTRIDKAAAAFEVAFEALRGIRDDRDRGHLSAFEEEELIDLSKLHDVIDGNGWSSSSIYC